MKKLIRAASLALTAITLIGFAACGSQNNTSAETSAAAGTATETVTETLYVPDKLPDSLDYNGTKVSVLWWLETVPYADEQNGEVVNDSLYQRDRSVEDRLNVAIKNIGESYTWDTREVYLGKIKASVQAADNAYDIVSGQYATMPSLIADGYMTNLLNYQYLDFSMPWWVRGLTDETTIDGKLYFVTGDITPMTIKQIACLFYNRQLLENYKLGDPAETIKSGAWTLDYFDSMLTGTYNDINGDGASGYDTDGYGFVVPAGNNITPFIQATGLQITTNDSEGYPELTFGSEKAISVVTRVNELMHQRDWSCYGPNFGADDTMTDQMGKVFTDGRGVYISTAFDSAESFMKAVDFKFSLAPFPKWDEAQDNYYTAIGESNTLFGIVSDCVNTEAVSATMEAMGSESYRTVSPAIYEIALKVKYSDDEATASMYDLIRGGVLFNFGSIYGFSLNYLNIQFKNAITANDTNWASTYASFAPGAKAAIDKLYAAVQGLPD